MARRQFRRAHQRRCVTYIRPWWARRNGRRGQIQTPWPPLPTLVWGFLSRTFCYSVHGCPILLHSWSSFFVRPQDRFFVPTMRSASDAARRRCQGWPLGHRRRRLVLDSVEHGVTLTRVGAVQPPAQPARGSGRSLRAKPVRSEGNLQSVRRTSPHNLVFGGPAKASTMMQSCASAAGSGRRLQSTRAAQRPGWASAHRHLGSSGQARTGHRQRAPS
jgi:hypothetical protein